MTAVMSPGAEGQAEVSCRKEEYLAESRGKMLVFAATRRVPVDAELNCDAHSAPAEWHQR
jgi:hypothetical protein